jgi:hypothetical protein
MRQVLSDLIHEHPGLERRDIITEQLDTGVGLAARLRQGIVIKVPPMLAPVSLAMRSISLGSVMLSRNRARTRDRWPLRIRAASTTGSGVFTASQP